MIRLKNSRGETRQIQPSKKRIEPLEQVAGYISSLDLSRVRGSLVEPLIPNQTPITDPHAKLCEFEYRRWLYLQRKYEGEILPPNPEIDMMWHAHVLDTYAYHEACEHIFGYYLHHNPYFGGDSPEEQARLTDAFETMLERYAETFGQDPRQRNG
ncbi:hypothetical protein SAMN04488539_2392 [Corynebacterium timonense]|uniref:Glycine-rich domain-containing protein-like n=1 Tax=Corynebacterium timonense TaxID=441500 RepID=A0A1H1V389_9CORY|nr:hypothetical protein SAMN04488539_2392 [Corynebacterium timonense]